MYSVLNTVHSQVCRTIAQPARPIVCHNFIQSKDQSWSIPVGCFLSNSNVTGISY